MGCQQRAGLWLWGPRMKMGREPVNLSPAFVSFSSQSSLALWPSPDVSCLTRSSDPDNELLHQVPPLSGWSSPRKPFVQPKTCPHCTTGAWRPSDTSEETQLQESALLPVFISLGCKLPPLDYPFDLLYSCTSEHLESVFVPLILTWKFQCFPEEK